MAGKSQGRGKEKLFMAVRKKVIIAVMIGAMAVGSIPQSPVCTAAGVEAGVSKKAYSLSKAAGTYTKKIKVRLRAKNGYYIYYSKNGNLTKKNVIKSGQSKTFTISKTTTLTLYKSKTAMTAKQLKSAQVKNNTIKYVYKIKTADTNADQVQPTDPGENTEDTDQPDTDQAGNTGSPGQPDVNGAGDPQTAQSTAAAMAAKAAEYEAAVADAKAAEKTPADTSASVPVITCSQARAEVSGQKDSTSIAVDAAGGMCTITIKEAGTYILTGGSQNSPAKNIVVSVDKNIAGEVQLVLDSLHIDNSGLGKAEGQDQPVISIEKGTKNVTITLQGTSSFIANSSFSAEPASAVIYAKDDEAVLTMLAKDSSAGLTIADHTDPAAYGSYDPTDGISSKGTLILQSGIYDIAVNGDCLKGSGSDGAGGIMVLDGTYRMKSMLGNGMKSKNGTISIYDGTIDMSYTAQDGINAKNYAVNITGGSITIDQCYGDGIQGENVLIAGKNTKIDIAAYYADAGKNYYDTQLGSGNYNTLTKTNATKTEVINVDTGSHKGIKAGTKACTYTYQSVADGSSNEAGKTYTEQASGGIIITGGQIKVNTAGTGIKYNGSMRTGADSGSLSPADQEGQYMIGAPEDTVHSNNDFIMTGGTMELTSADDGITAQGSLIILNDSRIDIVDSYEGIEGGHIIIGTTGKNTPQITIASNDDGVNAASDAALHYDYADESEEKCTKIKTASTDNTFYMLDGYLNVMIADDHTHSFSLPTADGGTVSGSFTANGDGIDCNGSFYAYGGTVIVYGTTANDNSPIDTDGAYYVGSGVTLLAVGSGGMAENPTSMAQAAVTYGGMTPGGGNAGGMMPGGESGDNGGSVDDMIPGGENGNNGGNAGSTVLGSGNADGMMPGGENGNSGGNAGGTVPGGGNETGSGMPGGMNGDGMGPNPPENADGNGINITLPDDGDRNMVPPNFGMPGMENGPHGQPGSSLAVSAGTAVAVLDQNGNTVVAFKAPKSFGYLFYSSPELTSGSIYTISSGGSVDGALLSESKYDYRYAGYQTESAADLAQVTAGN